MKPSKLLEALELGIPVKINDKLYRMIGDTVQLAASCNREPIYVGDFNASALDLAQEITEAEAIQLAVIKMNVQEKGLPSQFDYERDYFNQLGCDIKADEQLCFGS